MKEKLVKIMKIDGAKNPVNCVTKSLPANLKKLCLQDLGTQVTSEPGMLKLLRDTEAVELVKNKVAAVGSKTPWKPNYAQAASAAGIYVAQACLGVADGQPTISTEQYCY